MKRKDVVDSVRPDDVGCCSRSSGNTELAGLVEGRYTVACEAEGGDVVGLGRVRFYNVVCWTRRDTLDSLQNNDSAMHYTRRLGFDNSSKTAMRGILLSATYCHLRMYTILLNYTQNTGQPKREYLTKQRFHLCCIAIRTASAKQH